MCGGQPQLRLGHGRPGRGGGHVCVGGSPAELRLSVTASPTQQSMVALEEGMCGRQLYVCRGRV